MEATEADSGFQLRLLLAVTAAIAVAVAVFAAWCPLYATDTLCRYAPMAEAFAAGDWSEAFHPRFGVGMSVVSGILCFLGLNGLSACAVASTLAWALGSVPLWCIAARVFDRRTAWFAFALYFLCPQIAIWGVKGLREPFKVLGVLTMAWSVFMCRDCGWRALAAAAAGTALMVEFKPDAIPLCGLLVLAFAVADRFRRRSWALFAFAAAALQPMCLLTYAWTGYWLPASQYVPVFVRLTGGAG